MSPQQQLAKIDPQLKTIIETIPPPEYPEANDPFYDLVSCVVDQQLPHRSRGAMIKKLKNLLGGEPILPETILLIEEEAFTAQKLAKSKYDTLMRLAQHWQSKVLAALDWQLLTDEEVREMLSTVKGIGPWTIDMFLLFTLRRADIFPVDDYHLKLVMAEQYELDPKSKLKANMKEIATTWQPHRSLAVRYLLDWKTYLKKLNK
ncbi:MAG: hypothetical protein AAFN10_10510 [Bacteroidota bacterium]